MRATSLSNTHAARAGHDCNNLQRPPLLTLGAISKSFISLLDI